MDESGCSRITDWPISTNGRFVAVNGVPSTEVYSITGDKAGNLWLSGNKGLSHLRDGRLGREFPLVSAGASSTSQGHTLRSRGGLWLSFWQDGGVLYFKDGQVRASYTPADGLGKGACRRSSTRSRWGAVGRNPGGRT